ncbi:MAG: hypothetical protein KGL44_04305 [Sphingomonadales bacterium]|nr:hypothetical protein [Sphingomonadales bacterium]
MFKRAVLACGPAAAALALILAPTAAEARESRSEAARGLSEMSDRLNDPETQQSLVGMLSALTDAMMNMRVEPFARAAEKMGDRSSMRHIGRNTTLRDVAGVDAAAMQRDMRQKLPQAMSATAGMTGAMESMLPELEAMARRMQDTMGDRLGGMDGASPAPEDRRGN